MTSKLTIAHRICHTAGETFAFGTELATLLRPNSSLALLGDIGSGKTTFVKGLARGFGVTECVSSPSFNILHLHRGTVTLLHVDAYRLDGSRMSAMGLMLDDFLEPPYCLAVEWPELLHGFLETCDYKISFHQRPDFAREISLEIRE